MLHRSAPAALVQVLQGHFWGQTPAFVQADAGSFAGYRPAPHAEAAVRGAMHPPPRAVQPMRQGHAFRLPASIHVAAVGPGQPLPAVVQRKMESLFGTSFADVRVHVGLQARQIGAQAFTLGTDLYFAPGQYDPASAHGQRLLGHELTHVVQQRQGRVRNPFGSGVAVVQDPSLEAEAERMGIQAVLSQQRTPTISLPGVRIQPKAIQLGGKTYSGELKSNLLKAAWKNIRKLATDHDTEKEVEDSLAESVTPESDRNCTAVVEKNYYYHVAMNTYNGVALGKSDIISDYHTYRGDGKLHAEMILLDALGDFNYVGISKKCCLFCAATLQLAGIRYRGCHGGIYDTGWKPPVFLDAERKLEMIGPTATILYNSLGSSGQKDFWTDLFIGYGR